MIDKEVAGTADAVQDIPTGASIMISGFGPPGLPVGLVEALIDQGASELTVINNNAAAGGAGLARLFEARRVRKVVCSFPKAPDSTIFDELYAADEIELELVPQGTLAERIRAAGAGIGGFYTPTAFGTDLARGKEVRTIDGLSYVFERPLHADFALVKASTADRWGNLTYRKTARNFGPIMAAAAAVTIAEVDEFVPLGAIDPDTVITPGIYVDRVVKTVPSRVTEGSR